MKTTRIDIEGRTGKATIFRSGGDIVVNVTRRSAKPDDTIRRGIGRNDSWVISARSQWEQIDAARTLQRALDGQIGTAGDVADFLEGRVSLCFLLITILPLAVSQRPSMPRPSSPKTRKPTRSNAHRVLQPRRLTLRRAPRQAGLPFIQSSDSEPFHAPAADSLTSRARKEQAHS